MQAKDIPESEILDVIKELQGPKGNFGATRWEIEKLLPQYPAKVVFAKIRILLKRKVLEGCGCGCRGDFRIVH